MIASCFKLRNYKQGEEICHGGWYRGLAEKGFPRIKEEMLPWIKPTIRWDDYCRGCRLLALVVLINE
jgi:hypothetical protein